MLLDPGIFRNIHRASYSATKANRPDRQTLQTIEDPLWPFPQWLQSVCDYCKQQGYRPETLAYFQPLIQNTLNNLFKHEIDNSYETDYSPQELQMIHDGDLDYEKC